MARNVLVEIARRKENSADELTDELLSKTGSNISKALILARDKQAEEDQEALGKELQSLLRSTQETIEHNRLRIRAARKQVRSYQAVMDKIKLAMAYGEQTDNFVPLAILVGEMNVFQADGVVCEVPKDWKPTPASTPKTKD